MIDYVGADCSSELMDVLNSSINEIYIFKQSDLHFVWANKGALRNTQYAFDELAQLTPLNLKPAYKLKDFHQLIGPLRSDKEKICFETYHRRKDGTCYDVEVHLEQGRFQNQAVYIAIILDISDRIKQQKALTDLMELEKSFSSILYHSQNEIYIFYQDSLKFAWLNFKAINNMGYSDKEIKNMTPLDIKTELSEQEFMLLIRPLVEKSKKKVRFKTLHKRKDGSTYHVEVHLQLERFDGRSAFVAIILDVSGRVQQEKLINEHLREKTHQAYHDLVTGLPNRRALTDDVFIKVRGGNCKEIMAVFVDLDNFKDINDTLGHCIGDQVLAETARRLQEIKDEDDYLVRFGSDEFLYLVCSEQYLKNVGLLCEKIMSALRSPYNLPKMARSITASIGVATFENPAGISLDDEVINLTVQQADYALFCAKKSGKNNYYVFDDDLKSQLERRSYYLSRFGEDIELKHFDLYFQPMLHLRSNAIVGAEVLLRWRENGGVVPACEFIPLLEETGKIRQVGDWVLRHMTHLIGQCKNNFPEKFRICFNASVIQLKNKSFFDLLQECVLMLECYNVEVEMEITESVFASDTLDVCDVIDRIKSLGVRIAVDDFGTGYSCLEYLRTLPIDTLKIDKRFIDDCLDKKGFGILQSIITLAASLDLNIVAEGIETREQLNCLLSLERMFPQSSIYGQGYLFAKPMDFDSFIDGCQPPSNSS